MPMTPIRQEAAPDSRGQHLDKTLSVSHLLTIVTIAGSILIWAASMGQRVAIPEAKLEHSNANIVSIQEDIKDLGKLMREELRGLRADMKDAINAAKHPSP